MRQHVEATVPLLFIPDFLDCEISEAQSQAPPEDTPRLWRGQSDLPGHWFLPPSHQPDPAQRRPVCV
ncbi:hypothetical protein AALO_G00073420 [Alosa alosa]|uniref:Uncharacterized protein n=1 Tax=Alosa alosa TaxID=278164 RepID=A0AAV6H658_9TELE|nr:hypothetical protein AALO_G00073420 [Alosa alosa]